MEPITYKPIGVIRTPFTSREDMPIQPCGAKGTRATVELAPELDRGLKDLDGFSHIILIYHFHLSKGYELLIKPFLDDEKRGIFATRGPKRPNPIGLSVVKLLKVEGNVLHVENADIVDGTPLLDIKPYVSAFDGVEDERVGWVAKNLDSASEKRADDRFVK